MPYTPPAPRSPALASPSLHDVASNKTLELPSSNSFSPPRSPGGGRPTLPRSSSFSRSQRSRENLASENAVHNASSSLHADAIGLNIDTQAAQKTLAAAAGGSADSTSSSDDDDPHKAEKVAELEHAVRESLRANGVHDKSARTAPPAATAASHSASAGSRPETASTDVPKLSSAARKISHSRSSTDSAIMFSPTQSATETPQRLSASDGSEDEVDGPHVKPPFVRKKSGELVKPAIRPNMRRKHSSMPGTPTYGKKGVHFNDDIAQVRHFLQVDRPMAVSAGGSPVENFDEEPEFPFRRQEPLQTVLDMHLHNFPRESYERLSMPARLQSLVLSPDQKSLNGEVVVANLAFHKQVTARFTLDKWRTTSEVSALYSADARRTPKDEGSDLFTFSIRLSDQANLEKRSMFLCIRYSVNGQEFWDNNADQNFQVDFSKKQVPASANSGCVLSPQSGQSPPRSRKGSSTATSQAQGTGPGNLRNKPSLDDDFSSGFDLGSPVKLRRQAAPQLPSAPPPRRQNTSGNQFSSRYDFGASLSAALSHAQAQLGDKSGIKRTDDSSKKARPAANLTRHFPEATGSTESPRADGLLANKQPLDSRAYQEFVSKFCFFGSGKPASAASSPQPGTPQPKGKQPPASTDGQNDEQHVTSSRGRTFEDGKADESDPAAAATAGDHAATVKLPQQFFKSRESKMAPTFDSRSTSPASITLRYPQQETHSGWFSSGIPTPPAIHG